MATTGLEVFDRTIQKTNEWLNELSGSLGTDLHHAYLALRATLHALRDRLPVDEGAHLSAQLPMLVRGFYYEGWKPAVTPLKIRDKADFVTLIACGLDGAPELDPERAARAVFAVLAARITAGEAEDVVRMLPMEIRELWPGTASRAA
jgi:uncharacterized protein (DUF2267 family)